MRSCQRSLWQAKSRGTIFAGTHDSALKKSQLKVDLFNDLSPDIKNILHGGNRLDEFVS